MQLKLRSKSRPPLGAAERGGRLRDEREGLLAVLAVWGLLAWLVPEGGQPPIVGTSHQSCLLGLYVFSQDCDLCLRADPLAVSHSGGLQQTVTDQ